jgi:3-deoxy-D-manno-octulosonic-acid transferase
MGALKPVYAALRAALPQAYLVVSTITPTGMTVARAGCPQADALVYLPFDWGDCIGLALARVRPDLVVVAEKELWPNFLGFARALEAEVLVVNGRVSDRMMARARRWPWLVRWLLRLPSCLCVQSSRDADRLDALGIPPEQVVVAGNTKADAMAARDREAEAKLASELGVRPEECWLVAGSTHAGEEAVVLEAFARVRAARPEARLLLAPRHPERVTEVCAGVMQQGFAVARRSEGPPPREAVVVLDTMGELRSAYALGVAGFVGGTFVPIGGHNLLEPVAAGRPALFGPHTETCVDVAELVLEAGVGMRVANAEELASWLLRFLDDREAQARIAQEGPALLASQQGASQRCVNIARVLLEEHGGG